MPRPNDFPRPAGPLLEAVKVTRSKFAAGKDATYAVIEPQPRSPNKRLEGRRRTHLQCGMVLDLRNRFLIDCQIYDRSVHGARLRLAANLKLPRRIRVFDDLAKQMLEAEIAWKRGQTLGVTFIRSDLPCLTEAQVTAMRRKFYLGCA